MYVRINFSVWHVLKPKICTLFLISPKLFVGKITEYNYGKIAEPTLVQSVQLFLKEQSLILKEKLYSH